MSDSNFILFAHSCITSRCFSVNRPSLIHNLITIHLAIPRNRQYIGSMIRNWMRSKYGSLCISDHCIKVSNTCFFQAFFVLQYFHKIALFFISSTFLFANYSSISSNLPKCGWFLIVKSATFLHLWQATRADIWPQSFFAAGMSHAQHIIAIHINLLIELSYVLSNVTPSHSIINWSIIRAK